MQSFFSDQEINPRAVRDIVSLHRDQIPLVIDGPLSLSNLGAGEAHRIVRVTDNNTQSVLIRIGLRGEQSVESLANEQAILSSLAEGIAPSLYASDLSRTIVSEPYVIIEYCEGTLKTEWSSSEISRHAFQLARLHSTKFTTHGPINGKQNADPFSLLKRFDMAYSYWKERQPDMLVQPLITQFGRIVGNILRDRDHYFTQLTQFSVVHGDLHPLNIVISEESIRYIDWETCYLGDPAHDVSMLGWDIETGWQIALDSESMKFLISEYQAHSGIDESLDLRRDAWMLYTMFFDQIYHRTQIPRDSTGRQRFVVKQIEGYLARRFGLESLLTV